MKCYWRSSYFINVDNRPEVNRDGKFVSIARGSRMMTTTGSKARCTPALDFAKGTLALIMVPQLKTAMARFPLFRLTQSSSPTARRETR